MIISTKLIIIYLIISLLLPLSLLVVWNLFHFYMFCKMSNIFEQVYCPRILYDRKGLPSLELITYIDWLMKWFSLSFLDFKPCALYFVNNILSSFLHFWLLPKPSILLYPCHLSVYILSCVWHIIMKQKNYKNM